jgi:riboflavin synthase
VFTGIVEELGTVAGLHRRGDSALLQVHGATVSSDAKPGDSIAVNGCCLTVVDVTPGAHFTADVMAETLARTSIGRLRQDERVNLERSVRADARLGGHIVQGHIDGEGELAQRQHSEHWDLVRFTIPSSLSKYVAEKGSIAIDGVSLTVVEAKDDSFTVALIPTTLKHTTLGIKQPGAAVNLEVDVIAKYVERLTAVREGVPA